LKTNNQLRSEKRLLCSCFRFWLFNLVLPGSTQILGGKKENRHEKNIGWKSYYSYSLI